MTKLVIHVVADNAPEIAGQPGDGIERAAGMHMPWIEAVFVGPFQHVVAAFVFRGDGAEIAGRILDARRAAARRTGEVKLHLVGPAAQCAFEMVAIFRDLVRMKVRILLRRLTGERQLRPGDKAVDIHGGGT